MTRPDVIPRVRRRDWLLLIHHVVIQRTLRIGNGKESDPSASPLELRK